jgi:hypothetical protein
MSVGNEEFTSGIGAEVAVSGWSCACRLGVDTAECCRLVGCGIFEGKIN